MPLDHHHVQLFSQLQVLEAVIHYRHIGPGALSRERHRRIAVGADHHRYVAHQLGKQHRLVARQLGVEQHLLAVANQGHFALQLAAVAAADHHRFSAQLFRQRTELLDDGGLAGAP